jgi:peroxiredoxin
MYKRGLGIGIILLLIGIMVFNMINENKKESAIIPNGIEDAENNDLIPAGIEEGELAPDFKLETLEGETVQLSDYHGKKVLLNFWATWCGPCRQEMPAMQDFYDDYADEIEILAVNVTDSEKTIDDVQNFIEEFDFTYSTLLDTDMSVSNEYRAVALPTTYFIGTDGKIQAPRKMGEMTYEFMVETMESIK